MCTKVPNLSKIKAKHMRPGGTLLPLVIPKWKWECITYDFVSSLTKIRNHCDPIYVIVDRLTKSVHFIPIRMDFTMEKLARLYISKIVRYQGVLREIVTDCDSRFTSKFWGVSQEALGTQLFFITTFNPQPDGQSEHTIQTFEGLLQAWMLDFDDSWEEYLHLVEFSYNDSYEASIGVALSEELFGRPSRSPSSWLVCCKPMLVGLDMVWQFQKIMDEISWMNEKWLKINKSLILI